MNKTTCTTPLPKPISSVYIGYLLPSNRVVYYYQSGTIDLNTCKRDRDVRGLVHRNTRPGFSNKTKYIKSIKEAKDYWRKTKSKALIHNGTYLVSYPTQEES